MKAVTVTQGYILKRGEGRGYFFGHEHLIEVKVPEGLAEVEGPIVFEFDSDANAEIPLHVHREDDELHYLVEGSATYTLGELKLEAGPGSVLFLPKRVPHGITIGSAGARWLWLARPKMLGLPEEIAVSIRDPEAKRRAGELAENEQLVVEVFAKYGMDFLSPEEEEA